MSTLSSVELGVLGPLQVRQDDAPVTIPGAKPRAILTMLGLRCGSVVSADTLVELLWGEDPPRTAAKALQTHISSLRRTLGDGFVLTEGAGWALAESQVDASRYRSAARLGRDAVAVGDTSQALAYFEEALALWRGMPELPDGRQGTSERTRWVEGHAALVEDRADALLATGRAAEIIGELEAAVADAPLRERRWGQLMLALYRAGRQGDALAAYQRARALLVDELGVDPGPELRRLETAIVAQDAALEVVAARHLPSVMRAVTFLLTDIEGSTAAWEAEADAMAAALARHDELVEQVVTSRGGRLIKTRGEGDATFSVFERPSAAAAAAIELQDAIVHEPWKLREPIRTRVALHTGEVELRDGDYFGRAVNRAARLRSLAVGSQILCSGATAELVIDSLPDDVMLADLGLRELRNLARPEHVFELRLETAEDSAQPPTSNAPMERPGLPPVLIGTGPFVGRGTELERLYAAWQTALGACANAVLIAGEPGVGKTRLAGEWSRQAYEQGAVVLYGRCDEDLGAPYQPFAEALRSLVPCVGTSRLRGLRGVEALLPLVPGLVDAVPDLAAPTRADPDTERYALFDAVVALLETASTEAPVVLVLDDLHWAAKATLLLLRHLLRFGDRARVQIVGTYRSTDLDRSHPLAAMLADLHRDGTANRISLSGLDEDDVSAYVAKAGYDDEELGHALASVTGGNPFFLIEALRHVDESGGVWDPSTLPQGVREAVSRRLSRLPIETNKALATAAVVGSRFALDLVERVVGDDLVDAFDEAAKAGIIIEEPGGRYQFNHAIVRQSLLAELPSVRRMRLHQRIAATLEDEPGADDELLAELAHHYFECAWAGNAAKAVEYCQRAADQAMARLAYEGAADLYDHALHALDELDDELPDRADQVADMLVARCEALLAAGDVASAAGAVSQLQQATVDSARLSAWATCFDGQLSVLVHPERLDDVEAALGAAALKLAEIDDAAGEAKAHTVRATCLARLGRIGDCEIALDDALTAARRARDHRRVNAVLAGAPLAALWGPNPVPRAGGRCLDVVRLLRITTDSPAVEATSTRCQAVLEAFRGRDAAARRMIDSARRTVTELGLRHALLEVEQFAGIVELVLDDPAAAEPHLRQACNGFRRMGLDADTAETAALLGRACLALNRDAEADELCTESQRLAGHALKPAIAWRTLRAQLLSRSGDHDEARRVAQAATTLAERTDGLVDHGDACLSLATVLDAAGDSAGARAAAERAANLYERKGAAALAEKARAVFGEQVQPIVPTPPEAPVVETRTAAVQASERAMAAIAREAWDEFEQTFAPAGSVESRRKIVGFKPTEFASDEVIRQTRRDLETGIMRLNLVVMAVRGERLALARMTLGTVDVTPGAPQDEFLLVYGVDDEGRIALQIWFDVEDMDAAMAELDARHARFEEERPQAQRPFGGREISSPPASPRTPIAELDTACIRAGERVAAAVNRGDWDEYERLFAPEASLESRRKIVGFTPIDIPFDDLQRENRRILETGETRLDYVFIAVRGERLALSRLKVRTGDASPGAPIDEFLQVYGIDEEGRVALQIWFDVDDMDAAIAELDAVHTRFAAERPPARRLENAASRLYERFKVCYAARDWSTVSEMLADDVLSEDRRHPINSGVRQGRDALIAEISALAEVGIDLTTEVVATRGERLVLSRIRTAGRDQGPDGFGSVDIDVLELGVDGRFVARIVFNEDDFDAAIAELDARYLAGEAAAYVRTWSVITTAYSALNRREMPPTKTDWVNIDHRRGTSFAPGQLPALLASWTLASQVSSSIEVVHRLNNLGAVVSSVSHETSQEGFDAEWRGIAVLTIDGDLIDRLEIFDETDLDAAISRFEELSRPVRRLENAAARVFEKVLSRLAARDWDAVATAVADSYSGIDHRRVVNAENQHGRDAVVKDVQVAADLGFAMSMLGAIAIRGERLVLARVRVSGHDPETIQNDALNVVEIDADEKVVAVVVYDLEDFDAAIAELDARYLAGEAAAHSRTWSVIMQGYAALNRRELPSTTPDWVNIDHRRGTSIAPGGIPELLTAAWNVTSDLNNFVEAVHRLDNLGGVVTHVASETSQEGFHAEWRVVSVFTVEGDMVNRCEVFDEAAIDDAIARFEELSRSAPRLENTASRANARLIAYVNARDWDSAASILADDHYSDDRRRVTSAGIRRGPDADIENFRVVADLGANITVEVIATRGDRLVLTRTRAELGEKQQPFIAELLGVVETDLDGRVAAVVMYDLEDIEAAFEELDARYLAGEAAAHARTWSVISGSYAAINRNEMPLTTPDCVNIDRRRELAMGVGDLIAYISAVPDRDQDSKVYVETVHRLTERGAVVTYAAYETSQEGFDAEWRGIAVLTVDGDMVSRTEVFDAADLDAAIASFEELSQPVPRLENTASRVDKRFQACFAARDWDVMAEMLSDGFSIDDRRRVVNMGNLQGRDAELGVHAYAVVGSEHVTSTVIATRAQRLALSHYRFSDRDQRPDAFRIEMLVVVEIDADDRMAAVVVFDADDINAAIAELDARYVAGEAAAHSEAWLAIAEVYAALNRGEMPAAAPDLVDIDHRSLAAIGSGDLMAYLQAASEDAPRGGIYIETVHRLTDLGAVTTHVTKATSREGFEAEWRITSFFIVGGGRVNRYEIFDEADLEAALAGFEELSRPAARLENAATQVYELLNSCFAARDWAAITELLAADISTDDRRRVVGEGRRLGRDAVIAEISALTEIGVKSMTPDTIAIRGGHLVLSRVRSLGRDQRHDAFRTDVLDVLEIDGDGRVVARVVFDPDDFDAAFAELDARYLAGEAAAHADTWSVIAASYAAFNRHELPAADWDTVDHRRATPFASSTMTASLRAIWDLTPDLKVHIEVVHRLNSFGVVITHTASETSPEGFDAEWRAIDIVTVEGDRVNRCEIYDEEDFDAALARFEELNLSAPHLENAASQVEQSFLTYFAARDWDAYAEILSDDVCIDDRRHVVNAGVRRGRDAEIANVRALADIGVRSATSTVIAVRGGRLFLGRHGVWGGWSDSEVSETLCVLEINAENQIVARVLFDADDIDAALTELEARYLAGEAAAHARTWTVIAKSYVSMSRQELPAMSPSTVFVDHRRAAAFGATDLSAYIRAGWELGQNIRPYVAAVHRLSDLGAVYSYAAHGVSHEGFDAEWQGIGLTTVEGDMVNLCEFFDEDELEAALAKFDQLSRPAPRLENAATRTLDRVSAYFAARDWAALGAMMATDVVDEDRRRVANAGVRHGRDAVVGGVKTAADLGAQHIASSAVATRGDRLTLCRFRYSGRDQRPEAFYSEALGVFEIDVDEQVVGHVAFDLEDIDAAFEELETRYLTGEAAAHARTWSVIARGNAAANRNARLPMTPDSSMIDHRLRTTLNADGITAYVRATWDLTPELHMFIESVHRLNDVGTVVTHASRGTSPDDFEAEWRQITLFTVEGDLCNRCEIFDEANLDVALARFAELQTQARRVENTASQASERYLERVVARDWDTIAERLADDYYTDDRRHVVTGGIHGRDAEIASVQVQADLGVTHATPTVIAVRGERLALSRVCYSGHNQELGAFVAEMLIVFEMNADGRFAAAVAFDLDDLDAAFKELGARYLAGEAAKDVRTWSAIAEMYASFNRHELPATTPDWVTVDRRPAATFEFGDANEFFRSTWDLTPRASIYAETVHRLTSLGAVVTHVVHGTSEDGFDAEWRQVGILTVEGDRINRCELFDEADLDAALTRFEELDPRSRQLQNAASQVTQRFLGYLAQGNWDAIAETLADDFCQDDRRRVVGAGIRHGRDAQIEDMRAIAQLQITDLTSTVVATRGERLVLLRCRFAFRDHGPEAFVGELLGIGEINAHKRIVADVSFDLDDIDAAFEELDARYHAGEAAKHADTWSVVSGAYASMNRHELFATTRNWVNVDHRRPKIIEEGGLNASLLSMWKLIPDVTFRIEAVHRLSNLGAVCTHVAHGISQDGFDAEWRRVELLTVDGDLINRCEIFDETELDAAIAKFEELRPPTPRLENAVGRILERYRACFSAREWTAMSELLADDIVLDDRRRVVNAGVRRGREVHIADLRAAVEVGAETISSSVVATRGERLALAHARAFNRGSPPGEVGAEWLGIVEIDADERIVAMVVFDLDDIDAAYEELDARYVAGEADTHGQTWSVIARTYTMFNRRVVPASDVVIIDHRRGIPFAPGDLSAAMRVSGDLTPDLAIYIEAVHRLSKFGAVTSNTAYGTSKEGFDAEWRTIQLLTVVGDRMNNLEIFDEADLDAALARFEELNRQAPRLENSASQVEQRFLSYFAARNWAALAEILTDESFIDDRRPVVNAGLWDGRDVVIANLQAVVDAAANITSVIATRGERLALTRIHSSNRDPGQGDFGVEMLNIVEIDTDARIVAHVEFDPNDIDAAFEELEARYLAGEGAAYADTWSAIAAVPAGFNRQELPAMTRDPVYIDHRPLVSIEGADLAASIRAVWDITSDASAYIEAVHRLSERGAVITEVLKMTSQESFDAELWMIMMFTVEGDLICGVEVFDEAGLDTALARFEELHPPTRRLENAASQVEQRFLTYFAARDWDAYAEILSEDVCMDDRRRVVNAGVRHGRDAEIASQRAVADVGVTHFTSTVIAIRGRRLALGSYSVFDGWSGSKVLCVSEISAENQIVARVAFDSDDTDAAFEELDARYLAGEAAAHAHTWAAMAKVQAAYNRHEVPPTTADCVNIDHRPGIAFAPGDATAYIGATYDVAPNVKGHLEAVHRLGNLGVVVTEVVAGTSQEGFAFEWREVALLAFEGDMVSRFEIFDEADLGAALARFDELQPQAPRLENLASQAYERFQAHFATSDWDAIADMLTADLYSDDRRPVVGGGIRPGRDALIEDLRAVTDVEITNATSDAIATRGGRLALTRARYSRGHGEPDPFHVDFLQLVEIDAEDRITAFIAFDLDDIDAAFEELDARYLAGEAAPHAHAWSVIARFNAGFNRHEIPATDWVTIDHRRLITADTSDQSALIRELWDITPDLIIHIDAVHRLSGLGAVVTRELHGTSREGFEAEWRMIQLLTVEGDRISRSELFDEADLDTALARFEELHQQTPRLENAASRVDKRFQACFAARDWDVMAEMLAGGFSIEDRRRVVNMGNSHGRDAELTVHAYATVGTQNVKSTVIATRAQRLALNRYRFSGDDQRPDAFRIEMLAVVEIDADERMAAVVVFEVDDIDAAIAELDARYLAGEAAAHSHTWSVILRAYAALNRREPPSTTPDWVNIDHRRGASFAPGELPALLANWNPPDLSSSIEAVHRLNDLGAVFSSASHETSQEGFEAEWRTIDILTVEGDMVNRCEVFEEADLDAAIARFEELNLPAPQLENAASQVAQRFVAHYAARRWDAMAEILADGFSSEDRRRVVGAGVRSGRNAQIADLRTIADLEFRNLTPTNIATRGQRIVLMRARMSFGDQGPEGFLTDVLAIVEVDAEERMVALISFDPDDIDAAFAELDARYLAGEAAAYAHTWSVITGSYAAFNRHEVPAADWVTVDHRQSTPFERSNVTPSVRTIWDLTPDLSIHIEAVHRLNNFGALITHEGHGTSHEGFDAEWRAVDLLTVDGEVIIRCEVFDEADLDAALVRFDELDQL